MPRVGPMRCVCLVSDQQGTPRVRPTNHASFRTNDAHLVSDNYGMSWVGPMKHEVAEFTIKVCDGVHRAGHTGGVHASYSLGRLYAI
jgi:hypothetical protein